jgi:hypothetical protein
MAAAAVALASPLFCAASIFLLLSSIALPNSCSFPSAVLVELHFARAWTRADDVEAMLPSIPSRQRQLLNANDGNDHHDDAQ